MRRCAVAKQLTFHPGVDSVSESVAFHEVTGELAHLSAVIVDAYHTARGAGRQLVLIAGVDTRATFPLRVALRSGSLGWASQARDAFAGEADAASTAHEQPPPDGTVGPDGGRVELEVMVTSPPMEVGSRLDRVLEAVLEGLDLRPMRGWGWYEPVTQPWTPDELSRLVAARRPEPTTVVIVGGDPSGHPVTGLVTVAHETASAQVHVAVAVGASQGAELCARVTDALPSALVAATRVTSATASWWPGFADTTSKPAVQADAAALWALLGTEIRHAAESLTRLGSAVELAGLYGSHRLVTFPPEVRPEDVSRLV